MFIEDKNKEQRLKNRRALESERTEKINNLFDVIHEHITELYEQVMDGEIEIEQVTEEIKKRL
jgi:hypothetical protein